MEKFDYLVVGSGLYGSIFAHEVKAHGFLFSVTSKKMIIQSILKNLKI